MNTVLHPCVLIIDISACIGVIKADKTVHESACLLIYMIEFFKKKKTVHASHLFFSFIHIPNIYYTKLQEEIEKKQRYLHQSDRPSRTKTFQQISCLRGEAQRTEPSINIHT